MKLSEAFAILNSARADAPEYRVSLACGFTPLHLQTYLQALLQQSSPDRPVRVIPGLFGDLAGTLESASRQAPDAAAVVIEWSDLDPRLGIRSAAGWLPETLADMERTADVGLKRIGDGIERLGEVCPVAVSAPTLSLPPASHVPGWYANGFAARLGVMVAQFIARFSEQPNVRMLNPSRLDRLSPPAARRDIKSEFTLGFPYHLAHAEQVAALLCQLLRRREPMKGLITDLDGTLWAGILGEVGVDGITWSLEHRSQVHALYQQVLASLAAAGVLVGVASKNDPQLVREAFERPDLLLARDRVFPFEAGWGAKSESVRAILARWNIGPEAVAFIDDSPMELAEVESAFPEMRCVLFPANDPGAAYKLLEDLRDWFGKESISEEDRIRLDSLRARVPESAEPHARRSVSNEFLASTQPRISFDFGKDTAHPRILELVNKTNQFNLNGRRYAEAEWRKDQTAEGSFLLAVSYTDKFGPLGRIAVVRGALAADGLRIGTWVMSCRAFARHIEHHTLRCLFERFAVDAIVLDYLETPRNGPLREFLRAVSRRDPAPEMFLTRSDFEAACLPLLEGLETAAYG